MMSTRAVYDSSETFFLDGTRTGTCMKGCLYVPFNNKELSAKLCNDIQTIKDPIVRRQAMDFCDLICNYLYRHESVKLPNLFFSMDDGDAFFEWIFDNFRFGFLFCKEPKDSGWYLVSKVNETVERFSSSYRGKDTIDYIFNYIGVNA